MREIAVRILLSATLLLAAGGMVLSAQDHRISVSGKVLNQMDKKPVTEVRVFGYSLYEDAKDALTRADKALRSKTDFNPGFCIERTVNEDGSYDPMMLPPDGAILFLYPSSEIESVVKKVNGKNTVNAEFSLAIMLDESIVSVQTKRPKLKKPTKKGNTLNCGAYWPFPEPRLGRSDARFAVQSFVIDESAGGQDTLEYHYPIVLDGREYHQTQLRRKGYEALRDPLFEFSDSAYRRYGYLTDTTSYVSWEDNYYIDNPDRAVVIKCHMWFEDYNREYFSDSLKLADSRRISDPMRFLDYSLKTYPLDYTGKYYFREPRPVPMDDAKDMALKFVVGQARLDETDSTTMAQMSQLLGEIQSIVDGEAEGMRFNEYSVSGTSSPEGVYAKNLHLANERMAYIKAKIQSLLRKRVYSESHASVAGWDALADVLERDSLKAEAAAVREIVARYKDIDTQGAKIRVLPYYQTKIKPRLAELRSVKVVYRYELFRKLTPDEVLKKYREDLAGHAKVPTYEYWTLFQLINEGKIPELEEQEEIYRSAVKVSRLRDKHWQLAENELARFVIANGKADTTILAPHIFEDYRLEKADGTVLWCDRPYDGYLRNPAPLVANQVVMMLKAKQFERAAELVEMLPREERKEYLELYYITRCLAGYYDDDSAEGDRLYETVCATSLRNAFVMQLATGKFSLANLTLQEMDQKDPLTMYLRAQYLCQKNYALGITLLSGMPEDEQKEAVDILAKCFRRDQKYIGIAETDFDIFEDLFKEASVAYLEPEKVDPEDLLPDGAQERDGKWYLPDGLELVFLPAEGENGTWVALPEGYSYDDLGTFYNELYIPVEYKDGQWTEM